MEGILLPEVVLIDERDCLEVLLGELALSRRPLLLLHEVDAEEDAAVAAHHIVKVLAGGNAHVVGIPPQFNGWLWVDHAGLLHPVGRH